ncbi:MAG TPA: exodeoxyribonuclease VII large subunit, partial [Desulfobacterales bacterium]
SREYLDTIHHRLYQGIRLELSRKFQKFEHLQVQLETLSPTSILARGYSITRTLPEKRIVRDVDAVHLNQNLEILLAKGSLTCEVREKSKNG